MSVAESALRVIKDVILMRKQLTDIDQALAANAQGMAALTNTVTKLSERIAKLEGFIEGAGAMSNRIRPRLPRE